MLLFDWLTKKQCIAQSIQIFNFLKLRDVEKSLNASLDRLNLRSRFTDSRRRTFDLLTLRDRYAHVKKTTEPDEIGLFCVSF